MFSSVSVCFVGTAASEMFAEICVASARKGVHSAEGYDDDKNAVIVGVV